MAKLWVGVGCLAALLVGCDSSGSAADAGAGDGGGADAGADSGTASAGGNTFGEGCKTEADCAPKLSCDREVDQSFSASGLPERATLVPHSAFPGGVCTPLPAAPYDDTGAGGSCDPAFPQPEQGCGADGVCVAVRLDQNTTVYACRRRCDASDSDGPCERFGYTCSFSRGACVEGCQSDEECRLQPVDRGANGPTEAYDDASRAVCDPNTFRCIAPKDGPGATGAPCVRLDDCAGDGACVQALGGFGDATFPDGYCTKLGCDIDGRECGAGAVCSPLRPLVPGFGSTVAACFAACTVGDEPKEDRVGPTGHGAGCREGYRCHYNGGGGEAHGVCIGGNYNDVTENNVGAACQLNSDCYSPFGLGACLTLSVGDVTVSGTCTIQDCAVPALADDLCGAGNECIGLSGDRTFCAQTCATADDCADGFACTDDDADPSTPKLCYPACRTDDDCRKGEQVCDVSPDTMIGRCVASRP